MNTGFIHFTLEHLFVIINLLWLLFMMNAVKFLDF